MQGKPLTLSALTSAQITDRLEKANAKMAGAQAQHKVALANLLKVAEANDHQGIEKYTLECMACTETLLEAFVTLQIMLGEFKRRSSA